MPITAVYLTERAIKEQWAAAKKPEKDQILGFIGRVTQNPSFRHAKNCRYQLVQMAIVGRKPFLTAAQVLADSTSAVYDPQRDGGVSAATMRWLIGLDPVRELPPLVSKKSLPPPAKKPVLPPPAKKPVLPPPVKRPVLPPPVKNSKPPLVAKKPALPPLRPKR